MDTAEFTERLATLTGAELATIAAALRHEHDTADGDLAWWRATLAVNATLKRYRLTRQAGLAAHQASLAVLEAARRTGIFDSERDDVTVVARAASEVARALVVRDRPELPATSTLSLLLPWHFLVPVAA